MKKNYPKGKFYIVEFTRRDKMRKTNRSIIKIILVVVSAFLLILTGCSITSTTDDKTTESHEEDSVVSSVKDDNYELEKTVLLARHNVRSPISDEGSDLDKLTPHEWYEWSSDDSELSLLGGNLETLMGQYFRKYLAEKELMEENEQPSDDSVRFYSNSMQRTIATAEYFSSGFLPIANTDVEYHEKINEMDPVFNPQLTFLNDKFEDRALEEIDEMGGEEGLQGIQKNLEKEYELLADVLDIEDSEKAQEEGYAELPTDDLEIQFELNEEPSMTGSLQMATVASDALVLQYYEEPDAVEAAFGDELTNEQWEDIGRIKDVYGDTLMTAPSVATNIANPMLKEIKSELKNDSRKFTFLSGHDSNISSVLSALDFESYELPNSIEKTTPIGSNVVMEKWRNKENDEKFITFKMVYPSVDQIRDRQMLDLSNPPMVYDLSLKDIDKNSDGMYTYDDAITRFDESIDAYDNLKKE